MEGCIQSQQVQASHPEAAGDEEQEEEEMKAHYDPLTDFDPARIARVHTELSDDWADKESAFQLLKDTKESVLAKQQVVYLEEGKSAAAAKVYALQAAEYIEHLKLLGDARDAAVHAKAKYEVSKTLGDMRRTQVSLLKEQVRNNS